MRNVIRLSALILLSGLGVAALTGCQPEYRPENHGEGETDAHNFLVQAVDPRPSQVMAAPDQDGERAAAAYQRYRDGKVIKPSRVSTSDLSSQTGK